MLGCGNASSYHTMCTQQPSFLFVPFHFCLFFSPPHVCPITVFRTVT